MSKLVRSLKQYTQQGNKWAFVFPKTPKKQGQCKVIYCSRPARVEVRKHRNGFRTVFHPTCPTCLSRLMRANNPAKEAYRQIKDRAKRRNQVFGLTFAEFLQEIEGTDYLARRGTGIHELHLDRKDVCKGYVVGNIQVLTCAENLKKRWEVDYA